MSDGKPHPLSMLVAWIIFMILVTALVPAGIHSLVEIAEWSWTLIG